MIGSETERSPAPIAIGAAVVLLYCLTVAVGPRILLMTAPAKLQPTRIEVAGWRPAAQVVEATRAGVIGEPSGE